MPSKKPTKISDLAVATIILVYDDKDGPRDELLYQVLHG
jgi:hypothetical protein